MAIDYQGPEDVKYDDPGSADSNWQERQEQAIQQGGVQSAIQSQPAPQQDWRMATTVGPAWQPTTSYQQPVPPTPGYTGPIQYSPYANQGTYQAYPPQVQQPAYQQMNQYAYPGQYYAQAQQYGQQNNQSQSYKAPKSKIAAGVLGILFGYAGIHNFYLGRIGRGCLQLALTLATGGLLAPVTAIWGAIEGLCIIYSRPGSQWHKDGSGQELTD